MRSILLFLVLVLAWPLAFADAKPFKRVLVISGGGINPGLALGMIAGVQEMGWRPDLIIATCGAGMGAAIYNSEPSITKSYEVLTSYDFFRALNQVVIETSNGIEILNKLNKAKDTTRYPDVFDKNLLFAPQEMPRILRKIDFNHEPGTPRLIFLSARALFFPYQVGQLRAPEPLFQQTYFTDPETAKYLKGWNLPPQLSYPYSMLMRETEAISTEDTITAARAGIADPYLLNPSLVNGYYHFTGAVDLFPLDLAEALGDEVVASYPASLFLEYEDVAVKSGFGFKQTTRALQAIQHKGVKWVDISGADDISFNPSRLVLVMRSGIPQEHMQFKLGVGKQWSFGRDRAKEALQAAPGKLTDVRHHLRKPINPKLLEDFSCKNAYEWKTDRQDSCMSDRSSKCDRNKAKTCVPIR